MNWKKKCFPLGKREFIFNIRNKFKPLLLLQSEVGWQRCHFLKYVSYGRSKLVIKSSHDFMFAHLTCFLFSLSCHFSFVSSLCYDLCFLLYFLCRVFCPSLLWWRITPIGFYGQILLYDFTTVFILPAWGVSDQSIARILNCSQQ